MESSFIEKRYLSISDRALSEIKSELNAMHEQNDIRVLIFVHRFFVPETTAKPRVEEYNKFRFVDYLASDVPAETIWRLDGKEFAVNDSRWPAETKLKLDILEIGFHVEPI